jgi:hypothetical protein
MVSRIWKTKTMDSDLQLLALLAVSVIAISAGVMFWLKSRDSDK